MHVIRAVVSEHMAALRAGAAVGGDEDVSESDVIAASQRPGSAVHVGNGEGIAAGSNAPLLVVARPVVHSISAPVSVILSGLRRRRKVSCASSPRIFCSIPSMPRGASQTAQLSWSNFLRRASALAS